MASTTKRICSNNSCKKEFEARTADVKRGWAKFCCKSCKAIVQEKRTGQYRKFICDMENEEGLVFVDLSNEEDFY